MYGASRDTENIFLSHVSQTYFFPLLPCLPCPLSFSQCNYGCLGTDNMKHVTIPLLESKEITDFTFSFCISINSLSYKDSMDHISFIGLFY